jgi:ADYC domain-containing protein
MRFLLFLCAALLALAFCIRPALALKGALTIEGTEFVLSLDDGRRLRGEELVGVAFAVQYGGEGIAIRIDGADRETTAGGEVMLYRFSTPAGDGGRQDLCRADSRGRRAGFPLVNEAGGFTITCTSGAEGKCVLLGYRPWEEHPGGPPLRDLHRACVHLIRADYGGDDRASTRDGTTIDVYDRFGIQTPTTEALAFEAAWGVLGAVCVARPRIPETISLEEIGTRYPRLASALGAKACNDETAPGFPGALLFNRSRAAAPGG